MFQTCSHQNGKVKMQRTVFRRFLSSYSYKVPDSAKLSFREKGYAVLPKFLTEAEIAPLEVIYNKFMRGEVHIPGKDFCDMSQTFEAIKGKHPDDWQIVNAMRKWCFALWRCASATTR